MKKLIQEAHRRSLWQVLGIYLAGSWIVLQVIEVLANNMGLPDWVFPFAIILLLIGLPIVLATAFVQEGIGSGGAPSRAAEGQVPDAASAETGASAPVATPPVTAVAEPSGHHRVLSWKNAIAGGVLAFALLGLLAAGWFVSRSLGIGPAATLVAKGVLEEQDRILLADFENRTPDPMMSEVVTEALRIDLAQSDVIRLAEPSFVAEALGRMEVDTDAQLTESLAREVAQREGIKAVISGEVGAAGATYVVSAQLVLPGTGESVLSERQTASDSEKIVDAVDKVSKKLRERMGESLRTLAAEQPLERVTTANLGALQKYSAAVRTIETEGDDVRGIALLEEAVELDPEFAMAWRKLGATLGNRFEQRARTHAALTKAFEHRDRLSERERYLTMGIYYDEVTDEDDKAITAYRNLLDKDPDDSWALNNLGVVYAEMRDWERSEEFYVKAITVDSTSSVHFTNAAIVQSNQGKYAEAAQVLESAERLFGSNPGVQNGLAFIEAAEGDYEAAVMRWEAQRDEWAGNLVVEASAISNVSTVLTLQGKLGAADDLYRREMAIAEQRGRPEQYVFRSALLANTDMLIRDDAARGLRTLDSAMERHPLAEMDALDRPYGVLAEVLARGGRSAEARAILEEWRAEVPKEVRSTGTGELRVEAELALQAGDYRQAIEGFREAEETGCRLCSAWRIAAAFELAGQPDSAIAEYERYFTIHQLNRVLWDAGQRARSYERLGQLYDEQGDLESAAKYYAMFVELWANADEELQPRVQAAQARLEEIVRERG